MLALCTGPVTTPSNSPDRQPRPASSRVSMTKRALSGSAWPKRTGADCLRAISASSPAAAVSSGSRRRSGRPRRAAAACRVSGSAIATSAPGCARCARRTQSSGPTPPGSPATRASRGGIAGSGPADAGLDVGFGAQLAQEALVDLVGLALADDLARLVAAVLVGHVLLAGSQALDDVEAHVALEDRRDLAVGQAFDLRAHGGAVTVGREPAHVAAVAAGLRVVGSFLRHLGEILAAGDARVQRRGLLARLLDADHVAGRDHDVLRVVLRDLLRLRL